MKKPVAKKPAPKKAAAKKPAPKRAAAKEPAPKKAAPKKAAPKKAAPKKAAPKKAAPKKAAPKKAVSTKAALKQPAPKKLRPSPPPPVEIPLFHGEQALPYDPEAALRHLAAADRALGKLIEKVGPFSLKLRPLESPFESLSQSIVYQQLSGKAAATILGRVKALFPEARLHPEHYLTLDEQVLRGAGLSQGKQRAMRDLAEKVLAGIVPTPAELHAMDEELIIERLTAVRGIGRWTVEMLLLFALGRPDVFPVTDLGVRKGFQIAFGTRELPSPEEMRARADKWRPYRSVASWYLWRANEL